MVDIRDGTDEVQVPCPVCDKPNRVGQKFCRHCGASTAAVATPPLPDHGPECRECGTVNKTEAKFCRSCGDSLTLAIAPEPELEPGPETNSVAEPELETEPVVTAPWLRGAWVENGAISLLRRKSSEADDPTGQALAANWVVSLLRRKAKATLASYLIVGAVGLLVIIGGGVALRSAMAGNEAKPEVAATVEAVPSEMASEGPGSAPVEQVTPVMQGVYSAVLADQDVALTVIGTPSSVAQIGAILTYSNNVTGRNCGSALEPESGNNNTPGPEAPLNFRQVPVAGQEACPRSIPVSLDISGQTVGADGVLQSVQVTWLNPDSGEVMMSGQLVRNATQ